MVDVLDPVVIVIWMLIEQESKDPAARRNVLTVTSESLFVRCEHRYIFFVWSALVVFINECAVIVVCHYYSSIIELVL